MAKETDKRTKRLKVNVTPSERALLNDRAEASGKSMSDFLRDAGLVRKANVSSERIVEALFVLELVLDRLDDLSAGCEKGCVDCALVLLKMREVERTLQLFAPVPGGAGLSKC
ncbi:MAG: hypothetical protein AAGF78_08510 [Pseudomonadota bacterium]